jgi:hypothetical protein
MRHALSLRFHNCHYANGKSSRIHKLADLRFVARKLAEKLEHDARDHVSFDGARDIAHWWGLWQWRTIGSKILFSSAIVANFLWAHIFDVTARHGPTRPAIGTSLPAS